MPSRLILITVAAQFFIACDDKDVNRSGNGNGESNGGAAQAAPEMPVDIEIGDGIGAHGVSLEMRAKLQIEELIADGADPVKPHRIEYHLSADKVETAKGIVDWGTENGFEVVGFDEEQIVPGEWISIDLVMESKLELAPIWFNSSRIADLAESLICEYDGWGCEIVK